MRLFGYDAYHSLTRVFRADEPIVALDVGANEGLTARRILELFPKATVHAFEPSPNILPTLEKAAAGCPSIRITRAAVGSRDGTIDFNITDDHWCSSVLKPSELGKRFYGSWLDVQKTITVPIVTLDAWSTREHIAHVDLIKIDTQGYDLEVLKGAQRLMRSGVRAINCEFQFASEYEGCSTFSQIDRFMNESGFSLYQLHEVWTKGNEEQTSCGDGLWLRAETLAGLRARTDLPDLTPGARIRNAIFQNKSLGRVAIYGAGRHTRQALPTLGEFSPSVSAIIDDNPALRGTHIEGKPVIASADAMNAHLAAVILSSDVHEPALWKASSNLRAAGVKVIPLYGRYEN